MKLFKSISLAALAVLVSSQLSLGQDRTAFPPFEGVPAAEFPALPYAYNALEPEIDARTMEIHYDKHHRTYFTNFVNAVKGTILENSSI